MSVGGGGCGLNKIQWSGPIQSIWPRHSPRLLCSLIHGSHSGVNFILLSLNLMDFWRETIKFWKLFVNGYLPSGKISLKFHSSEFKLELIFLPKIQLSFFSSSKKILFTLGQHLELPYYKVLNNLANFNKCLKQP